MADDGFVVVTVEILRAHRRDLPRLEAQGWSYAGEDPRYGPSLGSILVERLVVPERPREAKP